MAAMAPERELLKRFEVQKFLGKGSYGSVYVHASRHTSRVGNLFGPVLAFRDAGDIAREDRASRRSPSARAGE